MTGSGRRASNKNEKKSSFTQRPAWIAAVMSGPFRFVETRPPAIDCLYEAYKEVCALYTKQTDEIKALQQELEKYKALAVANHVPWKRSRELGLRYDIDEKEKEIKRLRHQLEHPFEPEGTTGNSELDEHLKQVFMIDDPRAVNVEENLLYDAFVPTGAGHTGARIEWMFHVQHPGRKLPKRYRSSLGTRIGKSAFSYCLKAIGGKMKKRDKTCNVFTNVRLRETPLQTTQSGGTTALERAA